MPKKNLYVVTGCSRGLGSAISELLSTDEENYVIGISRTDVPINKNIHYVQLDLSQSKDVKAFSFPKNQAFSKVVLINNAGILGEINTLQDIQIAHLEDVMHVNYTAAMLLTTLFIKEYQDENCEKVIIHISSGAATHPYASWANYCASKAALEMFARCVNEEQKEKPYPIYCYAIAPGVIDTLMQEMIRTTPENQFSMKKKFVQLYEEGSLYSADKVAEKIIDVANHRDSYPEPIFRISI